MNFLGLLVGFATFLCIGIFHPIVIWAEYHFTKKCWMVFLVTGLVAIFASLFIENVVCSILIAVFGFSCFWSIIELFQQEKRVEKGWFPANPKRNNKK
ncbi:MAG: DUF4491 family protein [Bacteroidales bacterium]|nr:DUF4491 family protein [Bacteroidales bacterium]